MAQRNGLPTAYKMMDTISTHDWAHSDEWVIDPTNSRWEMRPTPGEAILLDSSSILISQSAVQHTTGPMIINFYIPNEYGADILALSYSYKDKRDWLRRSVDWKVIDSSDNLCISEPILKCEIEFVQKPVLWSSAGIDPGTGQPYTDAIGQPKLGYMTLEIADHQPYRNKDGGQVDTVAARYVVEIYDDA